MCSRVAVFTPFLGQQVYRLNGVSKCLGYDVRIPPSYVSLFEDCFRYVVHRFYCRSFLGLRALVHGGCSFSLARIAEPGDSRRRAGGCVRRLLNRVVRKCSEALRPWRRYWSSLGERKPRPRWWSRERFETE